MKRKFSFNLAPVKIPGKADVQTKQTPEPTPSHHVSSHRRHRSKDSLPSLDSPRINRRPLDARTEQELRAACALILQNFKPSDHGFADADPKLDFNLPSRRRERGTEALQAHVQVRRPTGAPSETRNKHDARTHSHSQTHKGDPADAAAAKTGPDLPMQANTGRRRAEQVADKDSEIRKHIKSPITSEASRSAVMRTETTDSDDGKSVGTPLTGSTDLHQNNGSTAPTTAAFTSGRSSKRTSHHYDSAAAVADAQAAEWMRQELEKRRQQLASQAQQEAQGVHRPPSRASSIKAGIKGYIFPGSATLSRSQSRESIRTMNSQSSSQGQPKRSGSSHGWRSWGLQRKSSSRSSSRPTTSTGRTERQESEKKPELNLNRELPPLPSLDTWKDPEQQQQKKKKEQRKSHIQGAHIATVMRPQDKQQQEYAAAVRKHHRRSGSDTLALRYANAYPQAAPPAVKTPTRSTFTPKKAAPVPESSMDFDQMMSAMSSTRHLDDQLKLGMNSHAPQQSTNTASRSPSMKTGAHAPNFSRKISTDVPPTPHGKDQGFQNVVQLPPARKEEQKSRLRKVFSSWMLKKERKDDWMQKIEKEGVKGGVMVQDEAALPPVVRY